MRLFLMGIAVIFGFAGGLTAVHLTVLTFAGLLYRGPSTTRANTVRLLILVPARNEEVVIANALDSINRQRLTDDVLLVVADRCTDATAELSRARGALVLERAEGDEPGRAAAVRDGLTSAQSLDWDAVVFVDADCTIEPGFLAACRELVASGAPVGQARTEAEPGTSLVAQATVAASALRGIAIPRGRDRLRTWVRLNGAGMILRRDIAEEYRFGATGASEDGQYSLDLCLAGVSARHIDAARMRYASANSVRAASTQRLRWEAGRLYTARKYLGPLLRARTRASLEAAVHLASPPLSVAVLCLVVAGLASFAADWMVGVALALLFLVLLAVDVVIALFEAHAAPRVWLALLLAPGYVVWKAWIQIRALATMSRADRPYEPTPRT